MVCVITVSAGHTQKLRLAFPVLSGDVPAREALLARVFGIDRHAQDSGLPGFVFNKAAQLPERPVMQSFSLLFVGLGPYPDVRQVFQRNTQPGAFSSSNDAFGNAMIFVFVKSPLFSAHLAQAALGRFRANALQGSPALAGNSRGNYVEFESSGSRRGVLRAAAASIAALSLGSHAHQALGGCGQGVWRQAGVTD